MLEEKNFTYLNKFKENDYKLLKNRENYLEYLKEKHNTEFLNRYDRQQNVERIKRINDYYRENLMHKLEGGDFRTTSIRLK